jgi:hypothetical protein
MKNRQGLYEFQYSTRFLIILKIVKNHENPVHFPRAAEEMDESNEK